MEMRTHGNEHWEFNVEGLMQRRDMSANDYPIKESERRYAFSHVKNEPNEHEMNLF